MFEIKESKKLKISVCGGLDLKPNVYSRDFDEQQSRE